MPAARAAECQAPDAAQVKSPLGAARPDTTTLGDEPIHVESEGASVTRKGDASLLGKVTVRQGDRTLTAETASYDAASRSFKVDGDVEYRDPQLRVRGASGSWNSLTGGEFSGTEFELPARPARGTASELKLSPKGNLTLDQVTFTTCPVGNRDWMLHASSITIDRAKQQGTGRNVRLDFKGFPLFYAPYISFPAGDARKSGLLFPSFGTSSKSGFEFGVPYYFNLAPNYDATLMPTWFSRRGIELSGNFRYLTEGSHGKFEGRFLPSDQLANRDRGYARLEHVTDFTRSLRFSVDLQDASDSRYFEDFSSGPEGTSITYLERHIGLQMLGHGWRASALLQNFQTIDTGIAPADRPYMRTPQLLFDGGWLLGRTRLRTSLDSELVHFERDTGVTGTRLEFEPGLAWQLRGPGWFFVPSASYRQTAYQLSGTAPGTTDSPTVGAPTLALDTGLYFDREAGRHGQLLQTLEPRVLYTWTPYRQQDALPVFDTGLPELDMVRLFSIHRYVGSDRIADANQLAVGMTSRLVDTGSGRQYLSATIGQQYFFQDSRVTLPGETPEQRGASDIIGELELSAYRNWNVNMGAHWDPRDSKTVLAQAAVQYHPKADNVFNLGYRFRAGSVEQVEASTAWRVARDWRLYARYVYSMKDSQNLDSFAGIEYESCCWRLRVVAGRYVSTRTGQQDTSVALQLELKGLSSVGTTSTSFFERNIRGYSRDSDVTP